MPTDHPPEVKFEIGHVLFIDIVGYSKLLINEAERANSTVKTDCARYGAVSPSRG